jgi:ATP-dependent protease ClpP protease subunit
VSVAPPARSPVEKIEADSDRARRFTAEEALRYDLVDHVAASAASLRGPAPH